MKNSQPLDLPVTNASEHLTIPKQELITYLKRHDNYFRGKNINNQPYEILSALKQKVEAVKNELPKHYRLHSNGYGIKIEQEKKVSGFNALLKLFSQS